MMLSGSKLPQRDVSPVSSAVKNENPPDGFLANSIPAATIPDKNTMDIANTLSQSAFQASRQAPSKEQISQLNKASFHALPQVQQALSLHSLAYTRHLAAQETYTKLRADSMDEGFLSKIENHIQAKQTHDAINKILLGTEIRMQAQENTARLKNYNDAVQLQNALLSRGLG
jgi:hypothetical protein